LHASDLKLVHSSYPSFLLSPPEDTEGRFFPAIPDPGNDLVHFSSKVSSATDARVLLPLMTAVHQLSSRHEVGDLKLVGGAQSSVGGSPSFCCLQKTPRDASSHQCQNKGLHGMFIEEDWRCHRPHSRGCFEHRCCAPPASFVTSLVPLLPCGASANITQW
jgi:hypothetical protein